MGLDPNNITYDALLNRLLEIVLANITLANMFAVIGATFLVATLLMHTMVPLRIANMVRMWTRWQVSGEKQRRPRFLARSVPSHSRSATVFDGQQPLFTPSQVTYWERSVARHAFDLGDEFPPNWLQLIGTPKRKTR